MRNLARTFLGAMLPVAVASSAAAQAITLRSDVLLYGDNTEFHNPFREGETIFGAAARLFVDFDLSPRATISLGAFGNQRFGSEKGFVQARPVIAMTIKGARSAFVFGTLPAAKNGHALLPPLQRETLAFERPYEAGLQWDFHGTTLTHSMWLEWQRLNTAEHRERFDGGLLARATLARGFSIPAQIHVVHEGGQLFASGPVHDSAAIAGGLAYDRPLGALLWTFEAFGLASKSVPDRQQPSLDRRGRALFARITAAYGGWRAHAIAWRARDFIKDEGDQNYLSIRRDGRFYRGTRDYAEAGLTRRFAIAPGAAVEVSGRFHRTERNYEYSYRVISVASLRWKLTDRKQKQLAGR